MTLPCLNGLTNNVPVSVHYIVHTMCSCGFARDSRSHGIALAAWWRKWCAKQPARQAAADITPARPLANYQDTLLVPVVVVGNDEYG